MADLIDRLNFRKSNKVVKFKAEQAIRDEQGNRITSTYATIDKLNGHLEQIVKSKDAAQDSAREALASEVNAESAAALIGKIIDNAVRTTGVSIDTILAASDVAKECAANTALIPNVDTYHVQAGNANVNANNANIEMLKEYLDAIVETLKAVINSGVFVGADGIQLAEILDKQIALINQKHLKAVSKDGEVPGMWNFPIDLV